MRILNTLQELWDYCSYCPLCKVNGREISIAVGPDKAFTIHGFDKSNSSLTLNCKFRIRGDRYTVKYNINCLDGSFEMDLSDKELIEDEEDVQRAAKAYFYFYLHADCKKCNGCYLNTSDVEINLLEKKVENFAIDRESFYLLQPDKDKFHIGLHHDQNNMLISRCFIDIEGQIVDDNRVFECPLINLDFSDCDKVISKLKTLILFS